MVINHPHSSISELDKQYVWHPYSSLTDPIPSYEVTSADGVYLRLSDGRSLIDGMSSWWCAIHGYNHPALNAAAKGQIDLMSHVMFGGITHKPAVVLCEKLASISPPGLNKVFLSDSGSVSVEVAIKMACQYWISLGMSRKSRLLTIQSGYHGDTFAAMSVCDPLTGMHHIFKEVLTQQFFAPTPRTKFKEKWVEEDITDFKKILEAHSAEIAAVILEPIVQGAGGMHFYSPQYLIRVRELCDQYDVLLIADEIATGFGRTGELFACNWANIAPDIMCLGKALTGGYMTLAATLCSEKVSDGICKGEAGCFMHGPTFMGNPLACAVANTSIDLLMKQDWKANIDRIQDQFQMRLEPFAAMSTVAEVRCLGAIGVVELHKPVDMRTIQKQFVDTGIWVRPFGKLVYLMPPFIITNEQLGTLVDSMYRVLSNL
ncbi:MAG: adenosylmethionine--8-amino-7-oxononanoate transaminase [Cellvibrionales bacterium TMED148]|nr:adenosylmethionine--8-amino-7-oxononanoate transaminase [Porticoccaceae bacterium]RPG89133.1 MAG: adenosylmethionine--8-amino-7-oxononanoate transaminase [Cellvibrionales bacterium TMED148]